jgi:hypothetical protein
LELLDLLPEVADHPVDLLDHGLSQDLDLDADLNRRDLPTGDFEARVLNGGEPRDELAEGTVATARLDAPPTVLDIEHALLRGHEPSARAHRKPERMRGSAVGGPPQPERRPRAVGPLEEGQLIKVFTVDLQLETSLCYRPQPVLYGGRNR